jgi:hypothetical protein
VLVEALEELEDVVRVLIGAVQDPPPVVTWKPACTSPPAAIGPLSLRGGRLPSRGAA